jgi:hypothetical protein
MVFHVFKMYLHKNKSECFIVDSFPVSAYENHKSYRDKIFRGKEFYGYSSSKKQFFFGIKVHMIVDEFGVPIEFCFTSGKTSDIAGLKLLPCGRQARRAWLRRGNTHLHCYNYPTSEIRTQSRV